MWRSEALPGLPGLPGLCNGLPGVCELPRVCTVLLGLSKLGVDAETRLAGGLSPVMGVDGKDLILHDWGESGIKATSKPLQDSTAHFKKKCTTPGIIFHPPHHHASTCGGLSPEEKGLQSRGWDRRGSPKRHTPLAPN